VRLLKKLTHLSMVASILVSHAILALSVVGTVAIRDPFISARANYNSPDLTLSHLSSASSISSLPTATTNLSGGSSSIMTARDQLKGGEEDKSEICEENEEEDAIELASSIKIESNLPRGGNSTATVTTVQKSSIPNTNTDTPPSSKPTSSSHTHFREGKVSSTAPSSKVNTRKSERRRKKLEKHSHLGIAKKLKNRNNLNLRRKFLHAGFGAFFGTLNVLIPKRIFVPAMATVSLTCLTVELLRYCKGFGWMNNALHFCLGGTLRKHEMEGKFTGAFYYFSGVTITSALFPTTCATLGIFQLALADPSASYFGRATRHVYWSRIEKYVQLFQILLLLQIFSFVFLHHFLIHHLFVCITNIPKYSGVFGLGRNKGILGFLGGALFCLPFNYRILSLANFGADGVIPGGRTSVALASLVLGAAGALADLCVPTPALCMPKKICGVPMPPFHIDDNVVVPIFSGYACTKIFDFLGWSHGLTLSKHFLF